MSAPSHTAQFISTAAAIFCVKLLFAVLYEMFLKQTGVFQMLSMLDGYESFRDIRDNFTKKVYVFYKN